MTKSELIESANQLKPLDSIHAMAYWNKRELLADMVSMKVKEHPDVNEIVGLENISMMENNHRNHANFIGSMLKDPEPVLLVEIIIWVYRTYQSHGFKSDYWPLMFDCWLEVLQDELSAGTYQRIAPIYNWMAENHCNFIELSKDISAFEPTFHNSEVS